jgi:hypothetical protein
MIHSSTRADTETSYLRETYRFDRAWNRLSRVCVRAVLGYLWLPYPAQFPRDVVYLHCPIKPHHASPVPTHSLDQSVRQQPLETSQLHNSYMKLQNRSQRKSASATMAISASAKKMSASSVSAVRRHWSTDRKPPAGRSTVWMICSRSLCNYLQETIVPKMSTWRKQAFRLKPWLICAYAKPGAELQTKLFRMVAS